MICITLFFKDESVAHFLMNEREILVNPPYLSIKALSTLEQLSSDAKQKLQVPKEHDIRNNKIPKLGKRLFAQHAVTCLEMGDHVKKSDIVFVGSFAFNYLIFSQFMMDESSLPI